MAEERDQGPHYIPELDPDNPESGPKVKQRMLWFLLVGGAVLLMSGGGLVLAGFERVGFVVGGIGIIMLIVVSPGF